MKNKIFSLLSIIVLLLAAGSCDLDETSRTSVSKDGYMVDASSAETVLLGVYNQLGDFYLYGFDLSLLFALPTDEGKVAGNSVVGNRAQASMAFTSTDSYVQATWYALYKGVYYANDFIEGMEENISSFPEEDHDEGEIQIAEAKCLRALFYFDLVRLYGHIPLMTSTEQSTQSPSSFVQADPKDVYAFIEQNLKEAIEVLPYADEDKVRASNEYRFSKGAALGLLAKVYATWAGYPVHDTTKWQDSLEASREVVSSGHHSLLSDYEQLWKNTANNTWDGRESLIEISFYSPSGNITGTGCIGKWNGVRAETGAIRAGYAIALYTGQPSYLWRWKDCLNDKRWDLTFADYRYYLSTGRTCIQTATVNDEKIYITKEMAIDDSNPDFSMGWRSNYNQLLCPKKWDTELYQEEANVLVDYNRSNVNWYILRYADVVLLYAEALNEVNHGPTPEAYEAVNMVRRRGYGFDISYPNSACDLEQGMSYEEFQQAIRDERSYELGFEGQRRYDLTRWGIYYEAIQETYRIGCSWHEMYADYFPAINYIQKGKSELLPIPQREVDLCGYEQNPGW